MAITVPGGGNPFSVNVSPISTQGIGSLHQAPETQYGLKNQLAGLEKSAGDFGKAMQKWQAEIDQTRVQDAANELNKSLLDIKYNPQTGYQNLQGKNALERPNGKSLHQETQDALKESYESIRKGLSNNTQRAAFDSLYRGMSGQLGNEVNVWMMRQQVVYSDDVDRQSLESAMAQAQSTDPTVRNSGLAAAKALTEKIYGRRGLDPDYSETLGVSAGFTIDQLVDNGDPSQARAVLGEMRQYMSPDQVAQSEKLIQVGELSAQAAQKSAEILANADGSYSKALQMIVQVNPEIRDKVRTNVRQAFADLEAVQKERNAERRKAAWSLKLSGQEVPESMLQEMIAEDPVGAKTLMNYDKKQADGGVKISDQKVLGALEKLADQDPAQFKALDIQGTYADVLTMSDIRALLKKQRRVDDVQFKDYLTSVKEMARAEGVRSADIPKVTLAASRKWDEWMEKSGAKTPTADDQKRMVRSLLGGSSEGWLWDSAQPQWRAIAENPGVAVSDLGSVGWMGDFDESEMNKFSSEKLGVIPPTKWTDDQKKAVSALYAGDGWPTDLWGKAVERCRKIQAQRRAEGKPEVPMTNAVIESMAKAMVFEGVK